MATKKLTPEMKEALEFVFGDTMKKAKKTASKKTTEANELRNDLGEALEYITMIVSRSDQASCGVAHLLKKYGWLDD